MESVETINARLLEYFGTHWDNRPIWRVVWSEDQFEKRRTDYTDSGLQLLVPEVRELPKYRQWIHNKYVLERLTIVPDVNRDELLEKLSYEPLWVFEDRHGNPLPPKWEAAKLVVDEVMALTGKESMGPKYIDEEIKNPKEARMKRINKLEEELFGNESPVGDALAHKQAVVVPDSYKKQE